MKLKEVEKLLEGALKNKLHHQQQQSDLLVMLHSIFLVSLSIVIINLYHSKNINLHYYSTIK